MSKWNGKLFILTDGRILKILSELEYRLYNALKSYSYHNNRGQHWLYERQCEFSNLERELVLENGLNKDGEVGYMTRKTISKTFKSLVDKKILKYEKLYNDEMGYKILTEKDTPENEEKYKFVQVNETTVKRLARTIKGQPLKMYMYLKGVFDSNGGKEFKINRETLAIAINEVGKDGKVGRRQLNNISSYMTIFYNMNLINVEISTKRENDGSYKSIYFIKNVTDELKEIPRNYKTGS